MGFGICVSVYDERREKLERIYLLKGRKSTDRDGFIHLVLHSTLGSAFAFSAIALKVPFVAGPAGDSGDRAVNKSDIVSASCSGQSTRKETLETGDRKKDVVPEDKGRT